MKVIHQLKEVSRTVNCTLKLSLKVNLCLLMIRFTSINLKENLPPLTNNGELMLFKDLNSYATKGTVLTFIPFDYIV
jgi:hypothetical protein